MRDYYLSSDVEISMDDLDLVTTYCTCGTPDSCEHIDTCVMALPIEILREVEALCLKSTSN